MNTDTMDFYCYKSVPHNSGAEDLDIIVLETESDKMIVKLDTGYSGGDGFKVVKRFNYTSSFHEYTIKVHRYRIHPLLYKHTRGFRRLIFFCFP